jgi:hypothetical protein
MSQPDPLFDMFGPADAELARLERELGRLRWQARELPREALVTSPSRMPIEDAELSPRSSSTGASHGKAWRVPERALPWLVGLAAAAAVLVVAFATRPTPPEPERVPAPRIQPAGSPAPDLRDPFAGPREPDAPTSTPALRDPFTPRQIAKTPTAPTHSDLVNPFESDRSESWPAPSTTTTRPVEEPHDLVDPFSRNHNAAARPDLRDPFAERSESGASATSPAADMPGSRSPDLVDPFSRPH